MNPLEVGMCFVLSAPFLCTSLAIKLLIPWKVFHKSPVSFDKSYDNDDGDVCLGTNFGRRQCDRSPLHGVVLQILETFPVHDAPPPPTRLASTTDGFHVHCRIYFALCFGRNLHSLSHKARQLGNGSKWENQKQKQEN